VVDPVGGRSLLPDGGPSRFEADPQHRGVHLDTIAVLLDDYARLQHATVGRHRWSVPHRPGTLNVDHPILHRLLDGYLDRWTGYAPLPELRRAAADAIRLGALRRCWAWLTNLTEADDAALAELGHLPWAWLEDLTRPVVGLAGRPGGSRVG